MSRGAGCFKNFFATIGCLTFMVALGVVGWLYRDQIGDRMRTLIGAGSHADGGPATMGVPSSAALRSAEDKEAAVARRNGPGYVRLDADEVASLIQDRMAPEAQRALDSLRVVLTQDRVTLEAQVLLDVFTPDLLGPLAELLGSRQPLRAGGEIAVHEPGVIAWRVDDFVISDFPFPPSAIPKLVNRLTGLTEGAFMIPVPRTVGEIRVDAKGVTLYRQAE